MNFDRPHDALADDLPVPAAMSLTALEAWIRQRQDPLPEAWLEQLGRDPRRGVRRLAERLDRSKRRAAEEEARLEAMLEFEHNLWNRGKVRVAGVDEAGVGPLAGPVVAAAVVFPPEICIRGIQDSKQLSPEVRTRLARSIRESAAQVSIGLATVTEIDRLNIYHAGLLAMRRAVAGIVPSPQHLLVDGREIPEVSIPQTRLFQGDCRSYSIAAASIIAKTERDRMMGELDVRFPGFGFAEHKGYPTSDHRAALERLGPCSEHRRSFPAVAEFSGEMSGPYYVLLDAIAAARTEAEFDRLRRRVRGLRSRLEPDAYRRLSGVLRRASRRCRTQQLDLPGFTREV